MSDPAQEAQLVASLGLVGRDLRSDYFAGRKTDDGPSPSTTRRPSRAAVDEILKRQRGTARQAVHDAVGAWKRARLGHRLHEHVSGRDPAENARIKKAALKKIDDIVSYGALSTAEQAMLARAAGDLRRAVEQVYYTDGHNGAPPWRADGYRVLSRLVEQLHAAGVSRRRAIEFTIDQLLLEVPPKTNPRWVYDFSRDEADHHGAMVGRLTTFLKTSKTR